MEKTSTQKNNFESEINLIDFINKLIESKKILFTTTFVFILAAVLYSFLGGSKYQSSLLLEMANNNVNGQTKYIESSNELKRSLQVSLNFTKELTLPGMIDIQTPAGDQIIQLTATSKSATTNETSLTMLVEFIINRHKNIQNNINDEITSSIISLNMRIDNFINIELNKLNSRISIVDEKISSLFKIIAEEQANLALLESDPSLLIERIVEHATLNKMIHELNMSLISSQEEKKSLEGNLNILQKYSSSNVKTYSSLSQARDSDFGFLEPLILEKEHLEKKLAVSKLQDKKFTRIIGEIETQEINKTSSNIFLGLIVGLFLGIFIILCLEPIKAIKWSKS